MYRPPQNLNRVKSIKNKFENIENQSNNIQTPLHSKNGIRSDLNKASVTNSSSQATQIGTNTVKKGPLVETKTDQSQSNPNCFKTELNRSPQIINNSVNDFQSKLNSNSSLKNGFKSKFSNKSPPSPVGLCTSNIYDSSIKPLVQIDLKTELKTEKPQCLLDGSSRPMLDRQLSDPIKRNIKRTPAFRVDKNSDSSTGFQCNVYNRNTLFENKVKQFNSVRICDKNSDLVNKNIVNSTSDTDVDCVSGSPTTSSSSSSGSSGGLLRNSIPVNKSFTRPSLIKSKSSHDFNYVRKKFEINSTENLNQSSNNIEEIILKNVDLSLLYTEPIPKALRNKNCEISSVSKPVKNLQSIYNNSTLKLTDKKEFIDCLKRTLTEDLSPGLTDSLKFALRKPLPNGPPPQKPPRTFQHPENGDHLPEKNKSFLHVVSKDLGSKLIQTPKSLPQNSPSKKLEFKDTKYKLKKLENALKNNKLRARRQAKVDLSTTSGEDSDDSLLFRSKSCRTLPKLPKLNSSLPSSTAHLAENLFGDFNCLNAISCTNPAYEKVKEPSSSFFVDDRNSGEPIYAEPYNYLKSFGKERKDSTASSRENRNSLYYMSTSLLHGDHNGDVKKSNGFENGVVQKRECENKFEDLQLGLETGVNKQASAENSSLSSFTSDLDPSPVADDPHAKIRCIIEAFETNKIRSIKRTNPKNSFVYDNVPTQLDINDKMSRTEAEIIERIEKFPVERTRCSPSISSTNSSPLSERVPSLIDSTESLYSSNRVDALKTTLKMTLDRSFNDNNVENDRDSDSEKCESQAKVTDIITKFQTYIKAAPKYCQPKVSKDTLFYCCLVIEKVRDCVQIKYKFPPKADIPPDIETLCFPESANTPPLEITNTTQECAGANTYSLLLTNEKGERTFGFCRRVLPEGSSHYLPLAYCILSKYRAPKFYTNILMELESRHGMQNKYRDQLISQFYHKKFPKPGESIVIDLTKIETPVPIYDQKGLQDSLNLSTYVKANKTSEYGSINKPKSITSLFLSDCDPKESSSVHERKKTELVITMPPDTRYEDADLKRLHKLSDDILLKVFSSLLLERKVIFISSAMSELSSCVDSLQSILYPFTWYHTFIPILPESLWDIVESPTPVICGVLSTDAILDRRIENGMVVNLDTNAVLQEEGDETKILSESMKKVWKRSIALAKKAAKSNEEIAQSIYLADAYLQVFISCLKNYRSFFVDGTFDKEEFLKSEPSKGKRRFLKMFTETCMFHAFMDAALSNSTSLTEFDKKIMMYGSEQIHVVFDKLLAYSWKK